MQDPRCEEMGTFIVGAGGGGAGGGWVYFLEQHMLMLFLTYSGNHSLSKTRTAVNKFLTAFLRTAFSNFNKT